MRSDSWPGKRHPNDFKMICWIYWFHIPKSSKTTFLHPKSLEMPTSQSSKATPQQLILGVLSLAGCWHLVTSFWPCETQQPCISTLVKCKERAACRCKACDKSKGTAHIWTITWMCVFDVFILLPRSAFALTSWCFHAIFIFSWHFQGSHG